MKKYFPHSKKWYIEGCSFYILLNYLKLYLSKGNYDSSRYFILSIIKNKRLGNEEGTTQMLLYQVIYLLLLNATANAN